MQEIARLFLLLLWMPLSISGLLCPSVDEEAILVEEYNRLASCPAKHISSGCSTSTSSSLSTLASTTTTTLSSDFNIPCHSLVIIIVYHVLWLLQSTSPPHNNHHDNHHHHHHHYHDYHLINDHNHPVHVHVQLYLRTPDVVCRQLWSRFPGRTQPWWTSLSLPSSTSSSSSLSS